MAGEEQFRVLYSGHRSPSDVHLVSQWWSVLETVLQECGAAEGRATECERKPRAQTTSRETPTFQGTRRSRSNLSYRRDTVRQEASSEHLG